MTASHNFDSKKKKKARQRNFLTSRAHGKNETLEKLE